jgi:hypothetical protein
MTDEEASRRPWNIPLWRLLPFAMVLVVFFMMSMDDGLFEQCTGSPFEEGRGRAGAMIRMVVAAGCSPYYLMDFSHHWPAILVFWAGVVLAVPQILRLWRRRL